MIVIVDSGGANLASVRFAFDRLGVNTTLTTDHDTIRRAARVIVPGVGAAADVMRRLQAHALDTLIPTLTQPVLGICVGMQVMFEHCEEDDVAGLALLPGSVRRLPVAAEQPVPHMGWNTLGPGPAESPLMRGVDANDYAYFVHSYAAGVGPFTVAATDYSRRFSAIVRRDNFHAVQFHPERSAATGARILRNFVEAC